MVAELAAYLQVEPSCVYAHANEPQFGFRNQQLFVLVARADAEPNLVKLAHLMSARAGP